MWGTMHTSMGICTNDDDDNVEPDVGDNDGLDEHDGGTATITLAIVIHMAMLTILFVMAKPCR